MAIDPLPNFRIQVTGTGVTNFDEQKVFKVIEKNESIVSLQLTDGWHTINYEYINNIRMFLLRSTGGSFLFRYTIGTDVHIIDCNDLLCWTPSSAFLATITKIELSVGVTVPVIINIGIYGD